MPIRKLILFDIDGTLLMSKGATREAKAQAMIEIFGTAASVRDHHFGGKTDWQILYEVLKAEGISTQEIGEKMARYETAFAVKLAEVIGDFDVEALAGSQELVQYFRDREDMMLGLVTGNSSTTAPIKLRAANFDPAWFVVGAFGSEAENRNDLPPLALKRAIQLSGDEIAPEDVIIIGDTVADVECARVLGAVAVTVFTGFEDRELLIASDPDYILDDLTQFLDTVPLD